MNFEGLEKNIRDFGWQCQHVFDPKGKSQNFSYSIGFEESFGHPEVLIMGLAKETMHRILTNLAEYIRNGVIYEPNQKVSGLLAGDFEVVFKLIMPGHINEYAGVATKYYDRSVSVLVMFWPDKNNVLPTEQGCELTVQDEVLKIV